MPRPLPEADTFLTEDDESCVRRKVAVLPADVRRPPPSGAFAFGRFLLSEPIGSGGMAVVHVGALADGGRQLFAVKRLHRHLAADQTFRTMLLDESLVAMSLRHRNIVATYGSESVEGELCIVMEYVRGVALHQLLCEAHPRRIPPRIAAAILSGVLRGLHAAHEAVDDYGRFRAIVHRDVSPANILVGVDGVARVLDFGIAKAAQRIGATRPGELKGKLAYMSPEQVRMENVDRRTDIHGAGVVLWEALTNRPLFHAETTARTCANVIAGCKTPPSRFAREVSPALDAIVLRALSSRPDRRYPTAIQMAAELDMAFADRPVSPYELATWVAQLGRATLAQQGRICFNFESRWRDSRRVAEGWFPRR
jgi:serine/threonine-protein kinase